LATSTLFPYTTLFRSSSPGDLAPVFDTILEKAMRVCDAGFGILWRLDGERVYAAVSRNLSPVYRDFLESAHSAPGPESAVARTRSEEHTSELQSLTNI